MLDESLVRLLNARAACALEIGRLKKTAGCRSTSRRARPRCCGTCRAINPGPLDDAAVQRLFERIIDEARHLERIAEGHLAEAESKERKTPE